MNRQSALACLILLAGCSREVPTDPAYVAEIDQWHAQRIERLRSDTGWLTLVGLHELRGGLNTVGSAPGSDVQLIAKAPPRVGELEVGDLGIIFQADPAAEVTVFGDDDPAPVAKLLLETDSSDEPSVLACGSLVFLVIERQDRFFLRVKDRQSEIRTGFAGIDRFPVQAKWRVTARLEGAAGGLMVPNVLGQKTEETSPGQLVFDLGGKTYRVSPTGVRGEPLFLVFADRTSGKATYPGGRFLSIEAPGEEGAYVLDFNKAYNPPCVFTPYATCPLPAPQNRLTVAIEAGEKMWGEHH